MVQLVSTVVVVLAPLLLVAWAIAPTRAWLQHHAYFDDTTILALLGLVISLTLVHFNHLLKRTEDVRQALTDMSKSQSGVIANGVSEVYPELMQELQESPTGKRTVDILGLTLFTAWNQLQGFLQNPAVNGWRVRLLCLSPEFLHSANRGVPDDWHDEAKLQIRNICAYINENRRSLAARGICIRLETYNAFPAMHGFMLGNGTLFISLTHWEEGQDQLAKPYHPYEKVAASDLSRRAEVYRQLFKNWMDHASSTGDIVACEPDEMTPN